MISSANFKAMLNFLGFKPDITGSVFTYNFGAFTIGADFTEGKLIYPAELRGREHNNTFDANENFVVFECVFRLLTKGYLPEDLELEKLWQLGRIQKSGRADICVYEKDSDNVLMIIECKTWGREFDNALNDTKTDGAQLFSYWQQEISAKWLVLYASDFQDGAIKYKSPAINCTDDKNLLLQAGHDDTLKLYINAHSAREKFAVWEETYKLELYDDIIFSPDTSAYDIGIRPLRKKDLVPFERDDKIINSFEEILRHNNVSDKENAFNRLIALFICKLVDEIMKNDDEEVEFQYRPRIDDYEMLQDRLQRLYTEGMREFMREEISYVPSNYPEHLFTNYTGHRRKAAIEDLRRTFRILKYYSNNDFAFKDVHNEELFYQNGKILVEVVQLFQRYKIVHADKNQLLGDLFEQLLNKGFKQNEGQFFTPMPLTRFIWDCLPLEKFETWPKVIDYACGAGHFLIDAVEAVNFIIESENNSWTRDFIYGIEKDYRLARVSKVSMFMHGAGDSNIIFGDGLENSDKIKPGTFDILTANPPYSVASFKQHLSIKNNTFNLLDKISPNSSEIEVLFVERIAQLLKSGGIAAVILPSSILSNDSTSYTGARQEILRNFKLRAIVKLGSKTFGATGTNTVIMFLEKYIEPPKREELIIDSIDAIFDGRSLECWEDEKILAGYLETQGLTPEEWDKFIHESFDADDMPEYFKNYLEAFSVKKLPERKFYEWAKVIEREKVFYYGLTYSQNTTIILAPSDNAGQKEFLGYDWSNKKGEEGIKIAVRGGKLYDENNREAEGTLAYVVRQSFTDEEVSLTEDNTRYAKVVRTCEMLDFSRVKFNAAIITSNREKFLFESKYQTAKLSSVCVINVPKSDARRFPDDTQASFVDMSSVSSGGRITTMIKRPIRELWTGSYTFFEEGDIITAKMMSSAENMKCAIAEGLTNKIGFGSSEFYVFRCDEKVIMTKFLHEFLNQNVIREAAWSSVTGSGRLRVPLSFYESMNIPLPPIVIQRKIVNECEKVDAEEDLYLAEIEICREKIESLFRELEGRPVVAKLSLDDRKSFTLIIGKRVLNSEIIDGGKIPVFSANVFEPFGYVDELLKGFEDFTSDSVLWGIDGDFMVNFMKKGQEFYPTDHCGVLRVITDKVHPRYMARVLEREGMNMRFSRSFRASLDRVRGITFAVPDMKAQTEAMNEVMKLEEEITRANKNLSLLAGKKEKILQKYLI